jgi:hypothetical protein
VDEALRIARVLLFQGAGDVKKRAAPYGAARLARVLHAALAPTYVVVQQKPKKADKFCVISVESGAGGRSRVKGCGGSVGKPNLGQLG